MSENVFQAERNLRVLGRGKQAGVTASEADKSSLAAVAAHEAKPNPHPQYLTGLSFSEGVLSADVPVSGWSAGPTIILGAGTWLLLASAHFIDTSAAANDVSLRIDGIASAGGLCPASGSIQISTSGIVVLTALTTITLEVNAFAAGTLAAALGVNPAGDTATRIQGVRLA